MELYNIMQIIKCVWLRGRGAVTSLSCGAIADNEDNGHGITKEAHQQLPGRGKVDGH